MPTTTPSLEAVFAVVSELEPPGTPLTTSDVADEFDCTSRTIYNKLDALVEDGRLESKKVGARGRVWWRPVHVRTGEGPDLDHDRTDPRVRRKLQEERDMFADGPAVVFRWNPDAHDGWPVEYVSENVEDVFGYTPDELESGDFPFTDLLLDEEIDRISREVAEHSDGTTERFSHQPYRVRTNDGDVRWVKDTTKIVRNEAGEITNYLGYLIDITERKRAEMGLRRLNDASRRLMNADLDEICDHVADISIDVLDVEYAAFWRYEGTSGELERRCDRTALEADSETVRCPDALSDRLWKTFLGGDVTVCTDLERPDDASSGSSLRSAIVIPLGRHGVICAGRTRSHSFVDGEVDLAKTVAATIETALDRAEGERRLAEQNEELQRLDQLNGLLRTIDRVLVDSHSFEAITRAVCERLTDSDHFEFAWIGERDPVTDSITPHAWAGVDDGYLETLTNAIGTRSADDPILAAVRTGELQVVDDIAIDSRATAWREATLERGARSCISIPLVYDESAYGVLTVYLDSPQPDERDHTVLGELGETIAHALDAAETKQTLLTDRVTELTLELREPTTVLSELAAATEAELSFDGLAPAATEETRLFFTARGVASEEVLAAAARVPSVSDVAVIRETDGGYAFEATISEATLASHVTENQGYVRALTVAAESATAVVDLPAVASVREFVESLQTVYPGLELVARRTRDRPIKSRTEFRDALFERLTDRQLEILETAYMSGFFESPRVRTGNQLSETLDITQSTFSYHLREAERRLCEQLFETES
ncbi:bacterio-opsin activator domain-containing protein [Natrialbaceae archaeon GCM10025810]|uniref:bacterio-opsin activator domain-containing protein n=1 Tax=Halovalidus salilacus TaxID=3075124 RepID=UPI003605B8C2